MEYRFALNGKKLSQNDLEVINDLRRNDKFRHDAVSYTPSTFENIGDEVKNADEFYSAVGNVIEDENTAKGLFSIFDTNDDGKLSSDELKSLRDRNGKVNSSNIFRHIIADDKILAYKEGSGTVLIKESIKTGKYIFGSKDKNGNLMSADKAAGDAISNEARLLPKNEQMELLAKIGVDISKNKTKDNEAFYKADIENGTEFYKVFDDKGMKKVIHSVMDKNGEVNVEVFRIENYNKDKTSGQQPPVALKKASENEKAKVESDAEYTYSATGKKLSADELQILKDIHNNRNIYYRRSPVKININKEVKNAEEFASVLSKVIQDKILTNGLFKILDKNDDGKLSSDELKILKQNRSVTSNDIWRITGDSSVSVQNLIKSGTYKFGNGRSVLTEAGGAISKNAHLLTKNEQMKKLEELGIDTTGNKAKKGENFLKINTEKGTEVYKVFEDNRIYKVVHSIIDKDNNVTYEIFNLYDYSKASKMEYRNKTDKNMANGMSTKPKSTVTQQKNATAKRKFRK